MTPYPLLQRIPAERHAHFIAKAQQGEPLTESEATEFGLPYLAGMRLIPRRGAAWTQQQLIQCFPAENRAAFLKTFIRSEIRSLTA